MIASHHCTPYSIYKWGLDWPISCLVMSPNGCLLGCFQFSEWASFQGSKELARGCQRDKCLIVRLHFPALRSAFDTLSITAHTIYLPFSHCFLSLFPGRKSWYLKFRLGLYSMTLPPSWLRLVDCHSTNRQKEREEKPKNIIKSQWSQQKSTTAPWMQFWESLWATFIQGAHKRGRDSLHLRASDKIMKTFIIMGTQPYKVTYEKWSWG